MTDTMTIHRETDHRNDDAHDNTSERANGDDPSSVVDNTRQHKVARGESTSGAATNDETLSDVVATLPDANTRPRDGRAPGAAVEGATDTTLPIERSVSASNSTGKLQPTPPSTERPTRPVRPKVITTVKLTPATRAELERMDRILHGLQKDYNEQKIVLKDKRNANKVLQQELEEVLVMEQAFLEKGAHMSDIEIAYRAKLEEVNQVVERSRKHAEQGKTLETTLDTHHRQHKQDCLELDSVKVRIKSVAKEIQAHALKLRNMTSNRIQLESAIVSEEKKLKLKLRDWQEKVQFKQEQMDEKQAILQIRESHHERRAAIMAEYNLVPVTKTAIHNSLCRRNESNRAQGKSQAVLHTARLKAVEKAFKTIANETGIADVNELVVMFMTQKRIKDNLEELMQVAKEKTETLAKENAAIEESINRVRANEDSVNTKETQIAQLCFDHAAIESKQGHLEPQLERAAELVLEVADLLHIDNDSDGAFDIKSLSLLCECASRLTGKEVSVPQMVAKLDPDVNGDDTSLNEERSEEVKDEGGQVKDEGGQVKDEGAMEQVTDDDAVEQVTVAEKFKEGGADENQPIDLERPAENSSAEPASEEKVAYTGEHTADSSDCDTNIPKAMRTDAAATNAEATVQADHGRGTPHPDRVTAPDDAKEGTHDTKQQQDADPELDKSNNSPGQPGNQSQKETTPGESEATPGESEATANVAKETDSPKTQPEDTATKQATEIAAMETPETNIEVAQGVEEKVEITDQQPTEQRQSISTLDS